MCRANSSLSSRCPTSLHLPFFFFFTNSPPRTPCPPLPPSSPSSISLCPSQVLLLALQHRHQPHDCTDLHHALHRCFPSFHISGRLQGYVHTVPPAKSPPNLFFSPSHVTWIGSVNSKNHKESDLFKSDLGRFHMWF